MTLTINKITKCLALVMVALMTMTTEAGTFVGNGGQGADVELQVSINQIRDTLVNIQRESDYPELKLCTCYEMYEGHPLCAMLKELNQEQVNFCAKFIKDYSYDILNLLNQSGGVRITWTKDNIEVMEGGRRKTVDAVANYQNSELTIQQDRFLQMKPYERLFLLYHEYSHFLKYEGKPLSDEGKIGPFVGDDGGRKLLNAMSASIAIEAKDYRVMDRYSHVLSRSRATAPIWISVSLDATYSSADQQSVYFTNSKGGGTLQARYQWDRFGTFVYFRSANSSEKSILDTIKARETTYARGVGVNYRHFFQRDPTTFWGQSHLLLNFALEQVENQIEIKEDGFPQNDLKDKTNSTAYNIGAQYFMPLNSGFWWFVGANYIMNKYKYQEVRIENKKDQASFSAGVSYAF